MDILAYLARTGIKKVLVTSVLLTMVIAVFLPLITSGEEGPGENDVTDGQGDDEIFGKEPVFGPELRVGYWDMETEGYDYYIEGDDYYGYFGSVMKVVDFNDDGYDDLAVSAFRAYGNYPSDPYQGKVMIFDGSYQMFPPNMDLVQSDARWTISTTSYISPYPYLGLDLDVGDVNGDGKDDLLISSGYYESRGRVWLFYGGDYWDSITERIDIRSDYNASFYPSVSGDYFGKTIGVGDVDADGKDDIFICQSYGYLNYNSRYRYGIVWYWFGTDFDGDYRDSTTADGYIYPDTNLYSSYYYSYLGCGGIECGDMDGDGLEEVVLASPYERMTQGDGSGYCYSGAVHVMHPTSSFRSASQPILTSDNDAYSVWETHNGPQDYSSYGYYYIGWPISVGDVSGDGLADLVMGAPYYPSYYESTVYIVKGSPSYTIGKRDLTQSGNYDIRLDCPTYEYYYFGSSAIGDWDGDGYDNLAVGGSSYSYSSYYSGDVFILPEEFVASGSGIYDLDSSFMEDHALLTIHGPRSNYYNYWAHPGSYSYSYSSQVNQPIVFWNRDKYDSAEDIFVSNYYHRTDSGYYYAGEIWGLANYDMAGEASVRAGRGDLPDYNTYYTGYRKYGITGSAVNLYDPSQTPLTFTFIAGDYRASVHCLANGTIGMIDDPWMILDVDPDSLEVELDPVLSQINYTFVTGFTFNLNYEGPLDIMVDSGANQHLEEGIATIRSKVDFVGELQAYAEKTPSRYDGEGYERLRDNEWVPEGTDITITGMKLIYVGTDTFMSEFGVEPFYPPNEVFTVNMTDTHQQWCVDDSSSGRNITLKLNTLNIPITIDYRVKLEGPARTQLLREVPAFKVRVDSDIPMPPNALTAHADSFGDPNTVVDNDGDLFLTWLEPAEVFSGIDRYEIMADGMDGTNTTSSTFFKIENINEVGWIDINVRAVDRVGHKSEWQTTSIYIDKETLEFSDFYPDQELDEWYNSLSPDCGITITDIGGSTIIGSSVEFAVSSDLGETFGPWSSAGYGLNAKSISLRVNPMFIEGTSNMIKFRAKDSAGNQEESDPFRVKTDVSGVAFYDFTVEEIQDWEGRWFEETELTVQIKVGDALSGVDRTSIEYRFTDRGISNLNSEEWTPVNGVGNDTEYTVTKMIDLSKGDRNYIQFRARDLVGNPTSHSRAFNLWVNTEPVAIIDSPETGTEVIQGSIITLDARSSYDMDGDLLEARWEDSWTRNNETILMELDDNVSDSMKFDTILKPGEHSLMLYLTDGLHEVSAGPVIVTVNAIIEPIWRYRNLDTDNDGMPNSYEYLYHLGWNDSSNGGESLTDHNDFDGDGFPDLVEYNDGTNPTDGNDFTIERMEGDPTEEEDKTIYYILIALAIIAFIFLILVLLINSMLIKNKLTQDGIKEAEVERASIENALSAGGREKLEALKAVSEGKAAPTLPSVAPTASPALPSAGPEAEVGGQPQPAQPQPAQPQPVQPQPIQPQPFQPQQAQPAPMDLSGQSMQAAPAPQEGYQDNPLYQQGGGEQQNPLYQG